MGTGIDPGMALGPFPSSNGCDKIPTHDLSGWKHETKLMIYLHHFVIYYLCFSGAFSPVILIQNETVLA